MATSLCGFNYLEEGSSQGNCGMGVVQVPDRDCRHFLSPDFVMQTPCCRAQSGCGCTKPRRGPEAHRAEASPLCPCGQASDVVLFCVMAERAVANLEEFRGSGSHAACGLERRLEVAPLGLGQLFLEVKAICRHRNGAVAAAKDRGFISSHASRQDAERDLGARFQSNGALHRVL